ncbi:MAG: LPS export ABC transporter periplasmic protein LptC [Phascolarctobacterium sp.]|nr:LPS export ABC transporter periplasmic protein LptC [Phascolarctobacterium sp.]
MKNKEMLLGIVAGIAVAGSVITWLLSAKPQEATIGLGNGVQVQANTTMKDTKVSREKDGEKLWEFQVAEVEQDKKNNKALLRGIKGKIYRKDGSYLDISSDNGEATLNKADNDFAVSGNVKAVLNTGGKLYADRVTYQEKTQFIQASGNVRLEKDGYAAYGDIAETTTKMEKFKLKGHAKVEKGGKIDDK